ncbi:MAG TPA: aminoglycoside phosphotransferase family protein [Acidimicrobiales bacterium]|nr:aminoglycoside phosphotransferase family protein [Acidimicrobiales bacterium]
MALHQDEVPVDEALVRSLLAGQCPQWADLPLSPAGSGTDNTMYRLGDELLIRLPRTAGEGVRKERQWLPRLAPYLPCAIPELVYAGGPNDAYPLDWSIYRWIDGEVAAPGSVADWPGFGADLAGFVQALHRINLVGARRVGALKWYRGGLLQKQAGWVRESLDGCRARLGSSLDIGALERAWLAALDLPGPSGPQVWLHGDLKPTNLLVRHGKLHAVIDFGSLSVGWPDAEHSTVWDLPPEARAAYRKTLGLDDAVWERARAWAIAVAASGIPYYWTSYPAFVAECRARLEAIVADIQAG